MVSTPRAVPAAPGALRAADDGPLELESIVTVLSAQFAVVTGSRQPVRRRRLDTFDRRLEASGLRLEHRVTTARGTSVYESGERLVLSRADGSSTVSVPVKNLRWPAPADVLPPGPLRDAIAPVAGIRALIVASDERRRLRRLELRNEDGKIVVRVELDEPASVSARAVSPAQVRVRRLRGYDEQARRADRLLAGLGLRPGGQGEGGDRAQAGSRSTQVAAPTEVADRSAPARVLLAAALGDFLETMRTNLPGLLDDVDTEFLHDFRVSVRRTRATLKLGRPALPEVMRSRWEPAFRSLGDLTTPVRDLDVYLLDLPTMNHWLVTADPTDLDPLAAHLRRRRATERDSLVRSLRSAKFRRLITEWAESLAMLGDPSQDSVRTDLSAGRLADRSISRAYQRVAHDGALIGAGSPAVDLHGLRKRCKELRYALEVFAPLVDQASRRRAVADLKDLQDVLGRFQDAEVQRRAMRGFAEEMMAGGTTAGAVLAMGELIGHLDVEQDLARRQFGAAFARFERPSSLRLMRRLEGAR
jgi:CHAD domain-containing protein